MDIDDLLGRMSLAEKIGQLNHPNIGGADTTGAGPASANLEARIRAGEIGSLDKHGNPNVLTPDRGTSKLAQGPTAQSTLVEVEKLSGEPPPVSAFEPPIDRSMNRRNPWIRSRSG